MKLLSLFSFALVVGACGSSPDPAKPAPAVSTETESAPSECVVPTTDAMARLGVEESALSLRHDLDFNDDGQTDTIVRVQSGREPSHLLYIRQRGCIRFLDKIEAFKIGCESEQSNGYCILWVETWLMHGDRRRSTMSFADGSYKPTTEVEFIPGPRDRQ
jgi:hypothetical protein